MIGIGFVTIYIGVSGSLSGSNAILAVISMVLGGAVGTLLDIDGRLNRLGERLSEKLKSRNSRTAEGFVTACLLFCIGSMTITGSLTAGLTGDNSVIYTKSLMDLISSTMLAASLGVGVLFSALFVLVFQGALVLLAVWVAPVLSQFPGAIGEMTCVGSILIIALGLNLTGVSKFKVSDYLSAVLIAPLAAIVAELIS